MLEKPRGVHLLGSVAMANADEVFRLCGSILGNRLRRLPDGETGERSNWIGWQYGLLASYPQFEKGEPDVSSGYAEVYGLRPRLKLRPGVDAGAITFGRLGYSDAAKSSYNLFARLKGEGLLPEQCRFQVSLPTPLAPVHAYLVPECQTSLEPAYETRFLNELNEILAAVPHRELAIQWDVAREIAMWEGVADTTFSNPKDQIIQRLVRLGEHVPAGVDLGYHLCYGDLEHRHFKEPEDTGILVEVANALCARISRPINWVHMPVPRSRTDASYFTPLRELNLKAETELYLGLVHFTDGLEGTERRIEVAQGVVPDFGVATECGMGRRPPDTIPELLRIHAQVSDPVR